MADTKPQDATRLYQLTGDEAFFTTDDPDGTPVDRQVRTDDITSYSNHFRYTVSATVATNDLTIALKDLDGNTPSSTYPVRVRIGDTEHTVSGALSVTALDGTNWCNAGSSELATKSVGYFVYLGYNATDGVVIGFSRIPWATTYSDFSTTSTDEDFCKINDITNAGGTDEYTVIGYVEATLSAGAGYTWSSPTNVISTPTYKTTKLSWVPQWTNLTLGSATQTATYQIVGRRIYVKVVVTLSSSTVSSNPYFSYVFDRLDTQTGAILGPASLVDTGTGTSLGSVIYVDSTTCRPRVHDASGTYVSLTNLSATIPHTWADTDVIILDYSYYIG